MPLPLLRTPIEIPPARQPLDYQAPSVLLGSCFTDHIGQRLQRAGFACQVNPFGVLYNPLSVADALERLLDATPFRADELAWDGRLWYSLAHHGRFSHPDRAACLEGINASLARAADALARARHLFVTWGTAWVYEWTQTGQVVANCHRQPAHRFRRRLATVQEIVQRYQALLERLHQALPQLVPVFSISPVRHWKDTPAGNQRSKATLVLAVHQLVEERAEAAYFPSYEIVMDELRDYRFYAEDLLHVGPAGQAYVWERFRATWIAPQAAATLEAVERLARVRDHRPHRPDDPAYRELLERSRQEALALLRDHPGMDLATLLADLSQRLSALESPDPQAPAG